MLGFHSPINRATAAAANAPNPIRQWEFFFLHTFHNIALLLGQQFFLVTFGVGGGLRVAL